MNSSAVVIAFTLAILSISFTNSFAQSSELFGPVPDGVQVPMSLDLLSSYKTSSGMAVLNTDALSLETVTVTLLGHHYDISRDYTKSHENSTYSWFGSNSDGLDAILVVDGTSVTGLIYAPEKTFQIFPVSGTIHEIYELDTSRFPPVSIIESEGASGASHTIPESVPILASVYDGERDYNNEFGDIITIDVYSGITTAADPVVNHFPQLAVNLANRIYGWNDLPIELVLVEADGARYEEADNVRLDLINLNNPRHNALDYFRAQAERHDADIAVLFVDDNETPFEVNDRQFPDDHDDDPNSMCALAQEQLPNRPEKAIMVVDIGCISAHSFTTAVGYIHGAGYDTSVDRNSNFTYGHGHVHVNNDRDQRFRTIMASSPDTCDDPKSMMKRELCDRQRIWSDPYRYFFGTTVPAGTFDEEWNSRVIFATAPHIASLRGTPQVYDDTRPTGAITLPHRIPTVGTLKIIATFSEEIHENYPPNLTIARGDSMVTATMKRMSATTYEYNHILDGDTGEYDLLFSNARDLFGNEVEKSPTSGGSYEARAQEQPDRPAPPDAVSILSETFQGSLSKWTLSGDDRWRTSTQLILPVPDGEHRNAALVSRECDDECILTLNDPLDTTVPLTLSFDRYVDGRAGHPDGLFVQYSTPGGGWTTLASYTGANDEDTDYWEHEVIGLSIRESSTNLRFVAHSNQDDEVVMLDNLRIMPPAHAVPDIDFTPIINSDLDRIIIQFTERIPVRLTAGDFETDRGDILDLVHTAGSSTATMPVTGVPPGVAVFVEYVGERLKIDGAYLQTGTRSVSNIVEPPDVVRPRITAPPDITREATGIRTSVALGVPSVRDNADPNPTVTNNAPASFGIGTTIVTWTARDSAGNLGTDAQNVTIRDTRAPVFTSTPTDMTHVSDVPIPIDFDRPEARDIFPVTVTCNPERGHTFTIRTTTVTCTATDGNGNTSQTSFQITVQLPDDTTPPEITAPADIIREATAVQTPVNLGTPNITDNRDPNPTFTNDAPVSFVIGTTTVTWTARDSSENTAADIQLVTVQDTTRPVFTSTPPDITRTSSIPLAVNYDEPGATDIFPVTVTCNPDSGSIFLVGTATVTCTVTDDNGNTAQTSFRIIINTDPDDINPVFVPDDITIDTKSRLTLVFLDAPIATDNMDPSLIVTNDAPDLFPLGTTRVTWTGTNSEGNVVRGVQMVTVRAPVPERPIDFAGGIGDVSVQFKAPAGIAAGGRGIYVADHLTDRIQVFDLMGNRLGQFGEDGVAKLSDPTSIALDDTRIFIADRGNHRVQVFGHDEVYEGSFGSHGSGDGEFDSPTAVEATGTMVYVADRNNNSIQVFEPGAFVMQFGADLRTNGTPMRPIGITANSTHVLVSDHDDHTVEIFTAYGIHVGTIGERGNGPGQFELPSGLELYEGRIYVADRGNHRIQVFDSSGVFVAEFGERGQDSGQFDRPRDVAIYEDTIYVADRGNHRVQAFTISSGTMSDGG